MKHLAHTMFFLLFLFASNQLKSQGSCATGISIPSLPFNVTGGSNCGKGGTADNGACATGADYGGDHMYYKYTPTADECVKLTFQVPGAFDYGGDWVNGTAAVAVLDGCPSATGTQCIANTVGATDQNTPIVLPTVNLTAGKTYYIVLSGNKTSNGTVVCFNKYNFKLENNVGCNRAIDVAGLPYFQNTASTCGLGGNCSNGACVTGANYGGDQLYYKYTPSSNQCISLNAQVGGYSNIFDGKLSMAVLDGCPSDAGTTCVANIAGATETKGLVTLKNLNLIAGKTYYIVLSGNNSATYGPVCFTNVDFRMAKCYVPDPPLNTDGMKACGSNNVDMEAGSLAGWQGCYSLGGDANMPPYDPSDPSRASTMGFKCGTIGLKDGGTMVNGSIGTCQGSNNNTPPPANNIQHTATTGTGTDPNTDNVVKVVAPIPGNIFSARLGQDDKGYGAECMWNTFTVTPDNALFTYMYAVVLQDPDDHSYTQRPRFSATISGSGGNPLACQANYEIVSLDAKENGFVKPKNSICGIDSSGSITSCINGVCTTKKTYSNTIWYKDWSAVGTDLTPYIGQQVTVKFCTADCGLGGHYAYAYVDAFCKKKEITGVEVACNGSAVLTAPSGFDGYIWYTGPSPSGTPVGTGASFAVPNPVDGAIYTVSFESKSNSGCRTFVTDTIHVLPCGGPTVKLTGGTICPGACYNLTAQVTDNPTTITWTPNIGNGIGPHAVCPTSTTTYTVIVSNSSGSASATAAVTVSSNPVITSTPQTICAGTCTALSATGASTYTWTPNIGSGAGPHNVCPTSTSTYSVTGTNASGCTGSANIAVTVNSSPVISASPATICAGDNAMITATGANTYTWNTGAQGPGISVNPLTTTTYTVTGTNNGCTGSTTVTVIINNGITIPVPPATICAGSSATLTAGGSAVSYTWSTGANTQSITVSPTVTTTYTLSGTSASGCTGTGSVVVTVNTLPVITTIPATICAGESAAVNANGAATYTWNTGGTGSSLNITTSSTTAYTVTGTSAAGCTGSATVIVNVNPVPVLTATPATICAGDNATITTNGATTYTWNTGVQGPDITVGPMATTTYTVTGTANGCTGSTTVIVSISNSITIPVPPASICVGSSATLTAAGSAVSYTWSTGENTTSITVAPSVTTTYTLSGTSASGCTGTGSVTVTVNPIPVLTTTPATICQGETAAVVATNALTYTWNTGGTGSSLNVAPTISTTYTVTGEAAGGCTGSGTVDVTVNPVPVVSVNSEFICPGGMATLTASGGNTYTWNTGEQSPGISKMPSQTTSYTVTGATSNCTGTATGTITVNQIPTIHVNSATVCAGTKINLTASGATSYTWMPGNTTGPSLSYTPSSSTTYTITGFVAGSCTNSATASVIVNPIPVVNFEPDTSGCKPLIVKFKNFSQASVANSSCYWNFGNGTNSTLCDPNPVTYTTPGIYSVTLTVTSNACSSTLVRPNIITVYPFPKALFTADPLITEIMEPTITFTNKSSGEDSCAWDFGDKSGSTLCGPEIKHTYEDTGTYNVCLTVKNTYTCPDLYCLDVIIKPVWTFYIPNAFTPNRDGFNELFIGKGYNIIEHQMWIYDRWGNLIYDTGKTHSPETAIGWDGRANGGREIAQEDVYVWLVQIKDIFKKPHKLLGHVTLVK